MKEHLEKSQLLKTISIKINRLCEVFCKNVGFSRGPKAYFYTTSDRVKQIKTLASSLEALIQEIRLIDKFPSQLEAYQQAFRRCHELLQEGFDQQQFSELNSMVPDLFNRHKEWLPPLEEDLSGNFREPDWFFRVEEKLKPVLDAAWELRVIGKY